MENLQIEIAAAAARLVVEDGQDYGTAKRQALRVLGLPARTILPDNDALDRAVREYIDLFCSETQPLELAALRQQALDCMRQLAEFRPYLTGATWLGTATRHSDIHIQLFCDDPKAFEIELINRQWQFEVGQAAGFRGQLVSVLSLRQFNPTLNETVGLHLSVYEYDDLRGARKPDPQGRLLRGNLTEVHGLLHPATAPALDRPAS